MVHSIYMDRAIELELTRPGLPPEDATLSMSRSVSAAENAEQDQAQGRL